MNKTTEALKLAEEALESCNSGKWGMSFDEIDVERALAAIREVLADHIAASGKVIAEPVKQEPVAHYKDAPHTIYLQTGCDDPEDCECSFNDWGDTTWCADQIHDTDIPYIRADYAAPISANREWVELTDDEIFDAYTSDAHENTPKSFARAVITAFKEKNR